MPQEMEGEVGKVNLLGIQAKRSLGPSYTYDRNGHCQAQQQWRHKPLQHDAVDLKEHFY